jgi:hypothetical protein
MRLDTRAAAGSLRDRRPIGVEGDLFRFGYQADFESAHQHAEDLTTILKLDARESPPPN